jgi:hypothetical protein
MRESDIQQDIVSALAGHERVAWCMVVTTGTFKVRGGHITTGHYITEDQKRLTGMSDIIGQLRDGRFFCIETKRPGKEPTEEQFAFLDLVELNGGVSGWCDSVGSALWILEAA